jgi:C-terminal processing protease CtpA/Prc
MRSVTFTTAIAFSLAFLFLSFALVTESNGQAKLKRLDRERAFSMLKNVRNKIKSEYYDPEFGGRDIDARFDAAEERLREAGTLGEALGIIAQAVLDLNDSHTRFSPPSRNAIIDYGWKMRMYGDKCLVTSVRQNSDAAKKGLEVGDQILAMNKFPPSRKEMWKMVYYYQALNPQTQVALTIRKPSGETRDIVVDTKVTKQKNVVDLTRSIEINEAMREGAKLRNASKHTFVDVGNVKIWRMPSFVFDPGEVDRFAGEFRNKAGLVLDLRGNPGGYVVTIERLVGYFFPEDKKIADLVGRKEMDPQMAKTQGDKVFQGKVVVLIDSSSASAAEIFARLMQLEGRGVVLGDVSAGAVMQSRGYGMDVGSGTVVSYGVSVTNADVIMSDGKSLEHVGVTPDEVIVPTGADLAADRDPVLARALEILGVAMNADQAGKLLPKEKYIERSTNVAVIFEF